MFLPDSQEQPSSLGEIDITRRETEICSKLLQIVGREHGGLLSANTSQKKCCLWWASQVFFGALEPTLCVGTSVFHSSTSKTQQGARGMKR